MAAWFSPRRKANLFLTCATVREMPRAHAPACRALCRAAAHAGQHHALSELDMLHLKHSGAGTQDGEDAGWRGSYLPPQSLRCMTFSNFLRLRRGGGTWEWAAPRPWWDSLDDAPAIPTRRLCGDSASARRNKRQISLKGVPSSPGGRATCAPPRAHCSSLQKHRMCCCQRRTSARF